MTFDSIMHLTRAQIRWIIAASTVLLIGTVYVYQTYTQFRESIEFVRNLLVASLTIASILITARSIRDGVKERRQSTSFAFIARYNNPAFFEHIVAWTLIWREVKLLTTEQEIIDSIEGGAPQSSEQLALDLGDIHTAKHVADSEKRRRSAVQMFNFFEEIAIAINAGGADEEILKSYFADILIPYYLPVVPWIKYCQHKPGQAEVYVVVETMVKQWRPEIFPPPTT